MIVHDLSDLQEVTFRACVRNLMFFATLPFYLAQEMRREGAREGASEFPRDRSRTVSERSHRCEDVRWLR
jgi:hypothetical protein